MTERASGDDLLWIPNHIFDRLAHDTRAVALTFWLLAHFDEGDCFPLGDDLAEKLGAKLHMTRRQIAKASRHLIEADAVFRFGSEERGWDYHFTWPGRRPAGADSAGAARSNQAARDRKGVESCSS